MILYVTLSCFKRLNFSLILLPKRYNKGQRKLTAVSGTFIRQSFRLPFYKTIRAASNS